MKVISPERERHPLGDKKYSKPVKTYSSCRGGVALFLDMAHPIKNRASPPRWSAINSQWRQLAMLGSVFRNRILKVPSPTTIKTSVLC